MGRREQLREELRALPAARWPGYLSEHSGLPGPRANLELAQAVADEGDAAMFDRLIGTDDDYLVLCGVIGLGRRLAEGAELEHRLRAHATDSRWRVREGVAMALQRLGEADPERLMDLTDRWVVDENALVQRAAVAGLCEPRLLRSRQDAAHAIKVCSAATRALSLRPTTSRREPEMRTLRQALGYCWSVAVAADPGNGLPAFLALQGIADPDVGWIVRENSRKARLAKLLNSPPDGFSGR